MMQINDKNKKIYVTHINIRQSIFFLMLKLIFLDAMAAFLAIIYFPLASNKYMPEVFNSTILSYGLAFFLTLFIAKVAITIYVIMLWLNEYYEIWPNAIIHKRGFIFKKEERHPLSHIRSLKVQQGFFGRNF